MLCDECKKNQATYHSIKKINGETSERHLCGECQQKYAGGGFSSLSGLFSGFNTMFSEPPRRKTIQCSKCGTTAEQFLKTGFVGCSNCYTDLDEIITPVIKRVQGDVQHTGKMPLGRGADHGAEYARIKKQLDKAVEEQNFEEAMILRDRMRALRGE
jgi:protein arginine kinase activator